MTNLADQFRGLLSNEMIQETARALQVSEPQCALAFRCAGVSLLAAVSNGTELVKFKNLYLRIKENNLRTAHSFDLPAFLFDGDIRPFVAGVASFSAVEEATAQQLVQIAGNLVSQMLQEKLRAESTEPESFRALLDKEKESLLSKVPGNLINTIGIQPYRVEQFRPLAGKSAGRILLLLAFVAIIFIFLKYCK